MSEGSSLTQYFINDSTSLFDDLHKSPSGSTKYPDVTHLLDGEVIKPPVSHEVIDFWEFPIASSSGIPPSLTIPCIYTAAAYQDYILEVSTSLLGSDFAECRKNILAEDDVTQDDRGLRQLILAGCYRAALNLTSRLLAVYGQGYNSVAQVSKNTSHSLGLWFTRLSLLLRLGQYEICHKESEAFGKLDRPDVFYQHYKDLYGGRKGSMACFNFRLLLAELPVYKGNLGDAMNNLTSFLEICRRIQTKFSGESKEAGQFWQGRVNRVMHSIINCSLLMKNYTITIQRYKNLITHESTDQVEKSSLQLALARVYLQCGDLSLAEKCLNAVFPSGQAKSLNECINRGLFCIAQGNFPDALQLFTEGLQIDGKNMMLHNNIAVCYLYTGKLRDAIKQYESAIELNPAQALNENLILNLATLYELESNDARERKLNLLKKIAKFKPDLNCCVDVCLKVDYKKQDESKMVESRDNYVV